MRDSIKASTGVEYRLNQQDANGIWYSQEGIYVRYDPVRNQLYFPDGSFWEFGAESAGLEEDGGTRYPTKMQDTNGNQIFINYATGMYALSPQSSARILTIEDARSQYSGTNWWYYSFTYNYNPATDAIPHLASIVNFGGNEQYNFTLANTTLYSPFSGQSSMSFGPTTQLLSVSQVGSGLTHNFTYNNNSCELTQVQFPYDGTLGWQFRDFTYSDNRVVRDMQTRTLNDTINGNQYHYFYHDDAHDYNTSNHNQTLIVDGTSAAVKNWMFDNTTGLQISLSENAIPNPNWNRQTFTYWATDSDGNPYITDSYTTIDPGTATQQIARTHQVRDNFGNLLQMDVYDYNNQITPNRSYTNTYYKPGNYINNRLKTSTVTPTGGTPVLLVSNHYDEWDQGNGTSACGSWGSIYGGTPSTAREFDPTHNGSTYRGNLTTTQSPGSTRCMMYDQAGVVMQTRDALGHTVSATADATHNYSVPATITTGNLTSSMQWNGAFQPTAVTNPNGATTGLAYDAYGRPSSTTSPYGAVTSVSYSVSPPYKLVTTKTRYSKSYLDGFGRAIKDETGYTATTGGTTTYTPVSVTETQYAPCGCTPMGKTKQVSIPRTPGATAYWTVYNYDALGRTTSVVQPNNSGTTTYVYAGNKVTVTDPAGAWKSFLTDAMGNLTQVTEPNPAGGNFDTFYTYTVLNQLTTVSMTRPAVPGPGGTVTQTRTFNYNGGVLLQSATNPENGTVSYTYNADGTVATKTDAKGTTLTYVYDSIARLIQVKNGAVVLRSLTYDDNSGYGQNLNGRLARVDYGAGNSQYGNNGIGWSELYSYHSAGAVLKKNLVMTRSGYKPANLEASWTYDDEGQVTAIKYPDYNAGGNPATGPTYTYSFDQMSRPLGLSDGGAPNNIASGATYGPAGQLTALNYGGIGESRSYNILNQLTAINSTAGTITYTYSAANNDGRITGMSSTISGETVTYAYDSLKRLITASAGSQWGLSFAYDGFGNRLSQNVTAGTAPTIQQSYDMATNRLLGQGYDNNGNMTSMGTFDVENRLVSTGTDTYDYAIDNKRIYKAVTGTINTEEVYFYAGGRRIATYQTSYSSPDAKGNIPVSFVQPVYNIYFGGKLIVSGGQPVVTDRLGSVVARLQTAYNLTFEKHSYFPYGEERTTSSSNRDKFGTYFRDASTGLDYADQRFYGSNVGRFISSDPFQASAGPDDPKSWNRYQYVGGDPVNHNDERGLCEDCGVGEEGEGWEESGESDMAAVATTNSENAGGSGVGSPELGIIKGGELTFSVTKTIITANNWESNSTEETVGVFQLGFYLALPKIGPPNSFSIEPSPKGPRIRVYGPDGGAKFDIDYQNNHGPKNNPHWHEFDAKWNHVKFKRIPPGSTVPPEPIHPDKTVGTYSPYPKRPLPIIPGTGSGSVTTPTTPIFIINPCLLPGARGLLSGCNQTGPL